ncbi:MAG TPA: Rne/Rng family ribonuclease [Terriglobales bacterium]
MNRELFVSSTPHETHVGLVEDDQLAEVYLERENEYTLAGSIYKGKVTRVLPGMQSAFVDIGLERDAFLYVSDFMELQDEDEVDDIPTQQRTFQPTPDAQPVNESAAGDQEGDEGAPSSEADGNRQNGQRDREGRGSWRGRRRRGRRGERMPEAKYASTGESRESSSENREPREDSRDSRGNREDRETRGNRDDARETRGNRQDREDSRDSRDSRGSRGGRDRDRGSRDRDRSSRDSYGPPPGYQPILLPGESISKYQRQAQAAAVGSSSTSTREAQPAKSFPDDEPLFAAAEVDQLLQASPAASTVQENETAAPEVGTDDWDREQQRLHRMNVARVFGEEAEDRAIANRRAAQEEVEKEEDEDEDAVDFRKNEIGEAELVEEQAEANAAPVIHEEVIEGEEADLADYVEELDQDAAFEELEEETQSADGSRSTAVTELAASGEPPVDLAPTGSEGIGEDTDEFFSSELQAASGDSEEDDEEAELDEAQAEAEALLAAEAGGNGNVDRAEVRAPAATAGYTQRAQRAGYERRGGFRGRRGPRGRFRRQESRPLPQITDLLKEGQEVLIQIAKEPIGKKGARITSHIALPGRFLVYMPTVNHTGVSRKINSEEERQRLKRIILSERENGHGGFIVRTAAQGANEEELRADIRFLKNLWNEIRNRSESSKAPALIYHDLNIVERVLRDQVNSDFSAIWVDTEAEYERILRFATRFQPGLVKRVKLYTKETPLYEQFGLNEEINKALKSKVWLKSGGYIVINQTEALVAIDVNTGKYVGKTTRLEDTIVKTNVDAIKEIVRQIRLRDLGGIIVIDFIDMDERRNRQKVMQALEEALRADRAPSKVLQFNDFGLVAITRKRVKQSLERTIGTPCPYCQATGYVKSVPTVCDEIYIEMRKLAKHLEHPDVMLRVNPEVAKALKANGARLLNELEELTHKTVIVKSDPALHQEQFDVN